jgi:hypothetical protein
VRRVTYSSLRWGEIVGRINGRRGFGARSLRAPLGGGASLAAPGAPTISASGGAIVIGATGNLFVSAVG